MRRCPVVALRRRRPPRVGPLCAKIEHTKSDEFTAAVAMNDAGRVDGVAIGIASGTRSRYTSLRRLAQKVSDFSVLWRGRSSPFLGTIAQARDPPEIGQGNRQAVHETRAALKVCRMAQIIVENRPEQSSDSWTQTELFPRPLRPRLLAESRCSPS
jgi:hypothetical protein